MVGLLDFFTGGDPEQMAQIDPRYGVPRADVRDAAVNTLGNISALLLAAGQPITPAQRAQLIAQIGPAAAGAGTDLYNAAQRRLMTAQVEQRRSEAEDIRRLDELRRNPSAFLAATGQDVQQFAGMSTRDMSQALRQIAIERAKPRQPIGGLEGQAQAFVLQAQRNPALLDTPEYAVYYTQLYGPRVEIRDGQVVQIQPPVPPGIFPPTQRAAAAAAAGGSGGQQGQAQQAQTPAPATAALTEAAAAAAPAQAAAPAVPTAPVVGPPIDLRRQPQAGVSPAAPVAPMSLAALQEQALRRELDLARGRQQVGREDQPGRVQEAGETAGAQTRGRLTAEEEAAERRRQTGRQNVEGVLRRMVEQYDILDRLGGITSENRPAGANIGAFLSSTEPGQIGGRALATPSQSARNVVESLRNQLITAIKNATGMSAQEMNSNVELQRLLAGVSGTTQSIQSVRTILRNLSQQYGLGELEFPETPAPAPSREPAPGPRRNAQPAPNPNVRPTLEQFLNAARRANPNVSDSALTEYYNQTYGGR